MTCWHPVAFCLPVCLSVCLCLSAPSYFESAATTPRLPPPHTHTPAPSLPHPPPAAPRGTGRARSRMVPSTEQVFFCDVLTSTACCHFRFKWMLQIEHTHKHTLPILFSQRIKKVIRAVTELRAAWGTMGPRASVCFHKVCAILLGAYVLCVCACVCLSVRERMVN